METETNPEPITPLEKKPHKSKREKIILSLLAVLLVITGGFAFWYSTHSQQAAVTPKSAAAKPAPAKKAPTTPVDPLLARFMTPTTGETWLPQAVKLTDQHFFSDDFISGMGDDAPDYYQVGKHGDNTIILGIAGFGLAATSLLFEKAPTGSVLAVLEPDGEATYNQDEEQTLIQSLSQNITKDTTIHYDSLTLPRTIDLDKGYVLSKPTDPTLGNYIQTDSSSGGVSSVVRKLGQSTLTKTEYSYVDTKLTSISYDLETPINTDISLTYEPLETDLSGYQWDSGNANVDDQLRPIAQGCGIAGSSVTRSDAVTDSDVEPIGKSPSGQTVYQLKDPNNPLLQKAYDEFTQFTADDNTASFHGITKDDFIKEHAVVLYKDKFGQWLVYARQQLAAVGGCAKPVVYLYPTVPERVNVKVGADVKVSDPLYNPTTGWQVMAYPDGQLVENGTSYSSLFWEGTGVGHYPSVTSGTVVKTADALGTIKKQLAQQGLNQTETNDFVNYWKDKLPTQAYTRLTWFDMQQMNQLAPLDILPKPTTLIRVFLDFSGLNQPIKLPAQKLSAPKRTGFTVVEWGGLSQTKLY